MKSNWKSIPLYREKFKKKSIKKNKRIDLGE